MLKFRCSRNSKIHEMAKHHMKILQTAKDFWSSELLRFKCLSFCTVCWGGWFQELSFGLARSIENEKF